MHASSLSLDTSAQRGSMPVGSGTAEAALQFITFTLGAEEYGIDIMVVREIKGWTDTTTIPNAPPHVKGVINLRGIIVPIFDLRARFGMGLTIPTKMHAVIIVAAGSRTVGLLVDAVSDIIAVAPKEIRPVPEMGMAADASFLEGLAPLGDRMVTLVSLARLFGDLPERIAGAEVATTQLSPAYDAATAA